MAPFIQNLNTGLTRYGPEMGRQYYGPSLIDPRDQPPMWMADRPRDFYEDAFPASNLIYAGAGAAALFALGFAPFGRGRVWDQYLRGMRAVEEYSPGSVFRTFQLSNFFSQFESPVRKSTFISPSILDAAGNINRRYHLEYLTNLIGEHHLVGSAQRSTYGRLLSEGVTLRKGKLYWGQGDDVALRFASAIRAPLSIPATATERGVYAASWLGTAWARITGTDVPTPQHFFTLERPFMEIDPRIVSPMAEGMPIQVVGAQTRAGFAARWARAWGTEFVGRFNRLLEKPYGLFPERIAQRLPRLAVAPGTGGQMLGRMAKKFGLVLPAIYMGYQTADWATRRSDIFEGTAFEEGITTGIATMGVQANLMVARIAQATGLQTYRGIQEEIAPGSTSLQKLLAFPIMGALGTMGALYGVKVGMMARKQFTSGLTAAEARTATELTMREFGKTGFMARIGRAATMEAGPHALYQRGDWIGKVWRRFAKPTDAGRLSFRLLGEVGPVKSAAVIGAAIGAALVAPFLPGALIPEKGPEELQALYSGKQEVAVRRGRWWEFGRSAYEGNRASYFRPHWYARLRSRARQRGIWGEREDEMSPLEKFWKQEFTYELEKMHYEERPYPITSVPFEDVPLIGPFLAGTIGRLIKPPRLMHTEEWMGEGGLLRQPPRFGQRVATEIGETAGPPPETPFNVTGVVGEQAYRLTEMIGLPGFVMTSIKEALTGTPDLFDQIAQLESARRISGMERQYWDLELGGGLGTTEFVRRLYPHRRRQIPLYNPIRNLMPEWLPGPGAKAPDFLHGDPYTKVMEGELRLPGRGYAARYPELEDIAPGEYPLVHRFKILADVAPYSDEFKEHLAMARAARNRGDWTEEEERIYTMTMDQLKEKKQRKVFQEYEYLSPMGEVFGGEKVYWEGEDESGLLAKMNVIKASREGGEKSLFSKLFGGYWELLSHNAETTLDQLTPISPGAKLVHMRTAIENYERTQLFGTENAFWSHPIRDFFRPSMYLGLHAFGYDEIPKHIQERRQMEEYFDVLKYVKNTRLANIARLDKDKAAVREFEQRKDQTLFGVNPYTRNFSSIFRALPRRERDYFNAFAVAETESERRRVLEIVPENERSLYLARWRLAFSDELRRAKKGEILTDQEEAAADEIIRETYAEAKTEGLPTSKELFGEYLETKLPNENYPDWYRRVKLLAGVPLPGPDWVGWHPSVDLDDVKLKVVQSLGEDMHDYDLWPQRAQVLMNKQYINEEAIAPILEPEELSSEEIRDRIDDILVGERLRASVFSSSTFVGEGTRVNIDHVADEPPINRRRLWQ